MAQPDEPSRLRRERNLLAGLAIAMLFIAIGASLPRAIDRRDRLKALDTELLDLQASIVATQQRTREVQAEIVRAQEEIRRLLKQP